MGDPDHPAPAQADIVLGQPRGHAACAAGDSSHGSSVSRTAAALRSWVTPRISHRGEIG